MWVKISRGFVLGSLLWIGSWGILAAHCVSVPQATLYNGPGKEYPKTEWKPVQYTPFRYLDNSNEWYKVQDVDGDIHWIHQSEVIRSMFCFVAKVQALDLWEGPGSSYGQAGRAKKYDSFRFVKRQGNWVSGLNADGFQIWVNAKEVWVQ